MKVNWGHWGRVAYYAVVWLSVPGILFPFLHQPTKVTASSISSSTKINETVIFKSVEVTLYQEGIFCLPVDGSEPWAKAADLAYAEFGDDEGALDSDSHCSVSPLNRHPRVVRELTSDDMSAVIRLYEADALVGVSHVRGYTYQIFGVAPNGATAQSTQDEE